MAMNEIGLWHAVENKLPTRLLETSLKLEEHLETWLFEDPTLIAPSLFRVRRQVNLSGKKMDLLAIEEPGVWVVCEIKKTPVSREALAQAIDYVTRIDMLSVDELEKIVLTENSNFQPGAKELITKALDRERKGEARNVRIVLAGIGVGEDLQHMVTYLNEKHSFPISVCTFSAMEAPGEDNGIILLRDVSEDSTQDSNQEHSSSSYIDKLNAVKLNFKSSAQSSIFDVLVAEFQTQPNFYVRPWTKSIMISPSHHHGRYLAYFSPLPTGDVRVMFSNEALLEFFPDAVTSVLKPGDADNILSTVEQAIAWAKRVNKTVEGIQPAPKATQTKWNGSDWYFVYGTRNDNREWADALKYGFVSAGGGDWYSRTVKELPIGARLFVYIPQTGYVGVGITTGKAMKFEECDFLKGKELTGRYTHFNGEPEYIVPINWLKTVPLDEAIYGNGLFASQLSTCKLRHEVTLKRLCSEFGVELIESKGE
jgi:hypothetical protein